MTTEARPPLGTRLILASEDLGQFFGTRTERGDRLTFEWGEPDENGWYTPRFTAHSDDNLAAEAAAKERERIVVLQKAIVPLLRSRHEQAHNGGIVRLGTFERCDICAPALRDWGIDLAAIEGAS